MSLARGEPQVIDLPFFQRLSRARSVLLLGAGGGYDVLGGVPLLETLRASGASVHLASVSFTSLETLPGAVRDAEHPCLFSVDCACATESQYCPEAWLARWLASRGATDPVWALAKTGVRPLRAALTSLLERLAVEAVVLLDGGVDLILRGDETSIGTPAEDLATLCAVAGLDTPTRLVQCLGFGTELRDGIAHAQVLERVAELQRAGGYLGALALHPESRGGRAYRAALAFLAEGQSSQRGSHVQATVAAAMAGEFGARGPDVWISPLAAICWYFSLPDVAATHLFLPELEATESIWDVTAIVRGCRKSLPIRPRTEIPL